MKKILLTVLLGSFAAGLAAAVPENADIIGFSTQGPDVYADGSRVLDGERYALVWTRTGAEFAWFNPDGTLADANGADSMLLLSAPLARGGRCEPFKLVADPLLVKAYTANGGLALYLLDTRTYAGGQATVGGAVQGAVRVADASIGQLSEAFASVTGGTGSSPVYTASALPAGTPRPKITGIRVEADSIVLTVANTIPALNYNVAAGETPAQVGGAAAETPVTGAANATIELRVPRDASASARFFRVERDPLKK